MSCTEGPHNAFTNGNHNVATRISLPFWHSIFRLLLSIVLVLSRAAAVLVLVIESARQRVIGLIRASNVNSADFTRFHAHSITITASLSTSTSTNESVPRRKGARSNWWFRDARSDSVCSKLRGRIGGGILVVSPTRTSRIGTRRKRSQNHEMHGSGGGRAFCNGPSTPATP